MKKTIFILLLFFCLVGAFAEESEYSFHDLINYLYRAPNSCLPEEGTEIKLKGGEFSVVSQNFDGNGMDYLVIFSGSQLMDWPSDNIYIYGENIKTRKVPYYNKDGLLVYEIRIVNLTSIVYTGIKAPAIKNGNKIEVPVFIEKTIK